jgi:hypothetical protein
MVESCKFLCLFTINFKAVAFALFFNYRYSIDLLYDYP